MHVGEFQDGRSVSEYLLQAASALARTAVVMAVLLQVVIMQRAEAVRMAWKLAHMVV